MPEPELEPLWRKFTPFYHLTSLFFSVGFSFCFFLFFALLLFLHFVQLWLLLRRKTKLQLRNYFTTGLRDCKQYTIKTLIREKVFTQKLLFKIRRWNRKKEWNKAAKLRAQMVLLFYQQRNSFLFHTFRPFVSL